MTARLAEGVIVGASDNPVVVVPGVGPMSVDDRTHDFLRALDSGAAITTSNSDLATHESICRLVSCGILMPRPDEKISFAEIQYRAGLDDFVLRRASLALELLVKRLAQITGFAVSSSIRVGIGLLLLIAVSAYLWAYTLPYLIAEYLVVNPLSSMMIATLTFSVSAVLHESGHYAVVKTLCSRTDVSFGLYMGAPAMGVDMSPIEAQPRAVRIRGDLAGLAIDGYVIAPCCVTLLLFRSPLLGVALLALVGSGTANLRPFGKTDGYWALRDVAGARRSSATLFRPRAFMRQLRSTKRGERTFAWLLCAFYSLLLGLSIIGIPRWIDALAGGLTHAQSFSALATLIAVLLMPPFLIAVSAWATARSNKTSRVRSEES